VIVLATVLGWVVSVGFSEPMNRWLRRRVDVGRDEVK
jgi:hypothetical protein